MTQFSRLYFFSAILTVIAASLSLLRIGPYLRPLDGVLFILIGIVATVAWRRST
jgi:hypothetical protein